MDRTFHTDGCCDPDLHYMVDLTARLGEVKAMVDAGKYFTVNRARQYGKTTLLMALAEYLKADYKVISLDFQGLSYADFESEYSFVAAFSRQLLLYTEDIPVEIEEELRQYSAGNIRGATLSRLFVTLSQLCRSLAKRIVLIIDEVDAASNNQVFIDFLAQLRFYYLKRRNMPVFQSVILAGVYDVRSVKSKIRPQEEHKENSPWNIAADFLVDMSFSVEDIEGMLEEYETDHQTGMDINWISSMIYEYTSGYPYLVSRFCSYLDGRIAGTEEFQDQSSAWSEAGFYEAEKMIVKEDNTLYQSLIRKLELYPELREILYELLFTGKPIPYIATNSYLKTAAMFGFIKNENDMAVISNRIFETVLYNYFIAGEFAGSKMYSAGVQCGGVSMVGKYKVITLCGSTRFKDAFMEAQKRLTLEGNIVISVGLFGHDGDTEVWEGMSEDTVTRTKEMLDDMHKRKIDMADEIYVINVGGYIGDSTRSEIAYARKTGKSVEYLETDHM